MSLVTGKTVASKYVDVIPRGHACLRLKEILRLERQVEKDEIKDIFFASVQATYDQIRIKGYPQKDDPDDDCMYFFVQLGQRECVMVAKPSEDRAVLLLISVLTPFRAKEPSKPITYADIVRKERVVQKVQKTFELGDVFELHEWRFILAPGRTHGVTLRSMHPRCNIRPCNTYGKLYWSDVAAFSAEFNGGIRNFIDWDVEGRKPLSFQAKVGKYELFYTNKKVEVKVPVPESEPHLAFDE